MESQGLFQKGMKPSQGPHRACSSKGAVLSQLYQSLLKMKKEIALRIHTAGTLRTNLLIPAIAAGLTPLRTMGNVDCSCRGGVNSLNTLLVD